MVLYLLCDHGEEKCKFIKLHENSRAYIFWKGRLIPYAKLAQLLPFMEWGGSKGEDKLKEEEKQAQLRTVLLLFLDGVSGVDHTKFHIEDDLDRLLRGYPAVNRSHGTDDPLEQHFTDAWWYDDQKNAWTSAARDLSTVKHKNDDRATGARKGVSLRERYQEWNKDCMNPFDRVVSLHNPF